MGQTCCSILLQKLILSPLFITPSNTLLPPYFRRVNNAKSGSLSRASCLKGLSEQDSLGVLIDFSNLVANVGDDLRLKNGRDWDQEKLFNTVRTPYSFNVPVYCIGLSASLVYICAISLDYRHRLGPHNA